MQRRLWECCLISGFHLFKGGCSCVPRCRSTARSGSPSNSTIPTKTPLRSLSTSTTTSTTSSRPTASQSPMRVSVLLFSVVSTFHGRPCPRRTSRIIYVKLMPHGANTGYISIWVGSSQVHLTLFWSTKSQREYQDWPNTYCGLSFSAFTVVVRFTTSCTHNQRFILLQTITFIDRSSG